MNPLLQIVEDLKEKFGFTFKLDPPGPLGGYWFLDVTSSLNQEILTVEYRPEQGFGLSLRLDAGYGEGPDEVYKSAEEAHARIVEILVEAVLNF